MRNFFNRVHSNGVLPLMMLIIVFGLFSASKVQAQCQPGVPIGCTQNEDCRAFNNVLCPTCTGICPFCYVCDTTTGACVTDDTVCEGLLSNSACQAGVCLDPPAPLFNNPTGCEYTADATLGATDLGEICYYCDPPRLTAVDTCGNGICDSPGEDCSNCSEDCTVPGWDQPTCPVDPNTIEPDVCNLGITFDGPPFNQGFGGNCEDGDLCTLDFCATVGVDACDSQPKTCVPDESDLCCPAGCMGPLPGQTCSLNDLTCDPDCWPTQVCGDGFVQSPETCDDSIPGPNAGFGPDGTTLIPDADCRDPGAIDECTFCGDGIIQTTSGEECDGASLGVCAQLGCDTTTCQCLPAPTPPVLIDQVQGSGPPWGPCSLNPHATNDSLKGMLGVLSLGLALGLLLGWRRRLG